MRCVCPMGGNRTCPKGCPLAKWASLSPADRRSQRKTIAEQLYKQGFTMEVIATQLGVTNQTISNDLRDFPNDLEIKKPAKTASNPKGAGRPKNSSNGNWSRPRGRPPAGRPKWVAPPPKRRKGETKAEYNNRWGQIIREKRLDECPDVRWQHESEAIFVRIANLEKEWTEKYGDWRQFPMEGCTVGILREAAEFLNSLLKGFKLSKHNNKEHDNVVQH
jgi:hypothetical protein